MFGAILLTASLGVSPTAETSLTRLGEAVANDAAAVRPGEVVVIQGNAYAIPLMESIAIAARNAGARPVMVLRTDNEIRAERTETPEEHLAQRDPVDQEWLASTDVWIGLPQVEDYGFVSEGNDESRNKLMASAYGAMPSDLTASKTRDIDLYWPSTHDAEIMRLPLDVVQNNVKAGLAVPPGELKRRAEAVRKALAGRHEVVIDDGNGGRFAFNTGDRPVFVNAGATSTENERYYDRSITLPSGSAFASAVETSAEGRLEGLTLYCGGGRYDDVSVQVERGRITELRGADCMQTRVAEHGGTSDRFAGWHIGVNPAMKPILRSSGGRYVPNVAAGAVTVTFGRNQLTEGENSSGVQFGFTLHNATVTVDGKPIIRDGRLSI